MMNTSTPLSDLLETHRASPDDESWAHFLILFVRSPLGVIGAGADPGTTGTVESTTTRPLGLGQTRGPAGQRLVLAFADPPAFIERFGRRFNAEARGIDLMKAVVANPDCDGILVNSARAETSVMIPRETAEFVVEADRESQNSEGMVQVPEGHQVTTYTATEQVGLARAPSGSWILNLGNGTQPYAALDRLREFLGSARGEDVLWFVRSDFVGAIPDRDEFLARVDRILESSVGRVAHVAVFVTDRLEDAPLMQAFMERGVGVYHSAEDDVCFVEVAGPSGIEAGLAGPPFGATGPAV